MAAPHLSSFIVHPLKAPALLLAPAASGKTHECILCVRALLKEAPLAPVWVVLPDRNQIRAFRRRLAEQGGALGARVGTFADLYVEILAQAGVSIPVTPEAVIHRLAQAAIDAVADRGDLAHYGTIRRRPGLTRAVTNLIAELKRARVLPADFRAAVQGHGPRLEELAALYAEYQTALVRLGWADHEGLGWMAAQTLERNPALVSDSKLLIADGFDSFNPTQLDILRLLAGRLPLLITLSGTPGMDRQAHRRFARTCQALKSTLAPVIESLPSRPVPVAPLAHLEACLFAPNPVKVAPGAHVAFLEAQTTVLEAREALRWIKARIRRDGVHADECAVIAHDLGRYRPFLQEAGQEFGLPLRFAGGEPLAGNPVIAAILNLLELSSRNWAHRPLLDAIRTPYLNLSAFHLAREDAVRLDIVARWGQVVEGLDQWREALDRLQRQAERDPDFEEDAPGPPPLPRGDAAAELWEHLSALAQRLIPPERARLVEFVKWIEDLIADNQGLGVGGQVDAQSDTRHRDRAALGAFQEVLRALVLGETVVQGRGELTYAEFYGELRGAVEGALYNPDDGLPLQESRIYLADVNAARGVSYRAVAVMGLSEGLFPMPLAEDPFLSDDERAGLAAQGLALEPRLRSDQQTLFYEAVTRASEFLLLTRPYLAEDGELWEPSPFWNAARELVDAEPLRMRPEDSIPLAQAASKPELFASAVRARALPGAYAALKPEWESLRRAGVVLRARMAHEAKGEFEGELETLGGAFAERFGAAHVWSSSRLETYASCPFRFFITKVLDLELHEAPKAGYDVSQLGSMLHKVLERVYQEAPDPTDVQALLVCLPAVTAEVFARAPVEYGFRPTELWQAQQSELKEKLAKTLQGLVEESSGFRPSRFEERFGEPRPLALETAAGRVLFHGVIDRLDRNPGGEIRVIDYKAGSSHLDARDLAEGKRLQLVLYALGAEHVLKLGSVVDGFYWAILKGKAGSLRLGKFNWAKDGREYRDFSGATELVREYVGDYVAGARAGRFMPRPPRDGCPDYCDAKLVCWRYAPSLRW